MSSSTPASDAAAMVGASLTGVMLIVTVALTVATLGSV